MPIFDRKAVLPISPSEFTALVRQHQDALCGFLYGLVGNVEQARDIAQNVFQDAWRVGLRTETPFIQNAPQEVMCRWLFRAAYYQAISALRRRGRIRWESLEEGHEREPETFSGHILFEDEIAEREAMRAALSQLAPRDAACLLLRIVHGFSARETANIVGGSPQSIDKRFSRAKQRLRVIYLAHETQAAHTHFQKKAR
jgi:RNA polymerase sigma-70 factor (ECF subfamily)